jgi:branched-subunit amino acid aminotransferase/4-amino-4-deoxychorismate lyase
MKFIPFYLVFTLFIFVQSCGNKQVEENKSQREQVIEIHDEVMPKMGQLKSLEKVALQKAEELQNSDTPDQARVDELRKLASQLNLAYEGMFVWMRQYDTEDGIRMVLSGGVSENHFSPATGKLFMFAESLMFPSEEKYQNGIKLLTLEHVRAIADIKTTNYTLPVWHSVNWKRLGAEDVLYHWNGLVSESSRSNFFMVKDGTIHTPDQHILHGITRKHLIEVADEVVIRPVSLEEVWEADEAFISSTTKVLLPVTQLDDRKIGNGKSGKITLDLLEKFRIMERETIS